MYDPRAVGLTPAMCQDGLIFLVRPFGSTMKKASKKEVEVRNFYGRKIRMYVKIGVTTVKFCTILDRKNLTAVKFGREERCDPC
jgi:hypothetical protein